MNIGNRIKEYRKKAKLSQKELAQKIGKGYSTVQKYELNLTQPPIDVLNKIADVLNIGASALFADDDNDLNTLFNALEYSDENNIEFPLTNPKMINTTITLYDNEITLVKDFRELNELGKEKAADYVHDLTENPKYKK